MKREFKKGSKYIILTDEFLTIDEKYDCVITETGATIFPSGARKAIVYGDYVALRATDLVNAFYVAEKKGDIIEITRRDIYLQKRAKDKK